MKHTIVALMQLSSNVWLTGNKLHTFNIFAVGVVDCGPFALRFHVEISENSASDTARYSTQNTKICNIIHAHTNN